MSEQTYEAARKESYFPGLLSMQIRNEPMKDREMREYRLNHIADEVHALKMANLEMMEVVKLAAALPSNAPAGIDRVRVAARMVISKIEASK